MGEKDQKLEDGDAKLLIEVEGLKLTPIGSDEPVLKGVDLNVREGDFIGIFGESGCGKTLLCFALSGVIPNNIPAELKGKISYSEELLTQSGVLGVGLVFQNPEYQLLSQTVEDEIAFGPSNLGWDEEDIAEAVSWALKSLGIEHLRDRRIDTLSMGEKQRVAVASVLSMRPKVLILDEPTAYVDPQGCEALLESLRGLNEKFKIAVILVEHDLQLLARYARRTYKLEDGRLHDGHQEVNPGADEIETPLFHLFHVLHHHEDDPSPFGGSQEGARRAAMQGVSGEEAHIPEKLAAARVADVSCHHAKG